MNHWNDLISMYLSVLKAKGMAERTVKESIYPLNQFKSYCENRGIDHPEYVKEKDILDYAQDQLKSIKASTLIYKILLLKQFFGYLTQQKIISYDVSVNIKAPKPAKPLPRQIPTPEEYVKLVGSIDTSTIYGFLYRTIIELLYGTGMRMEELVHLKLKDIDLSEGKVHLYQSKTLKDRVVPITEIASRYLKAYFLEVRPKILSFSEVTEVDDIVFVNIWGNDLDPRRINSKIKEYCKKAGLDKALTSHCFRFAYASHLYENKADIRYICELLGHRSLSMTAKYIIISKKALVDVVKKHHPREGDRL
jgi:integrase/recombinase XerD